MIKIILLIEDAELEIPSLLSVLSKKLPKAEFVVKTSATEAISYLKKDDADLIVFDIPLDQENSADILHKLVLGSNHPAVVVIASTGDVKSENSSMLAGVDAFMTKPINSDHLAAIIKMLLVNYHD